MKDPAFLFYPGDWLGGTMTFNRAHKGAYMDILMAQFSHGHLTIDDIKIILGNDFEIMWEFKLKKKFTMDEDGLFFNERLEIEMTKRRNFTLSRRNNLKSEKKSLSHMGDHKENHIGDYMENRNRNRNTNALNTINVSFEKFWDLYDKKKGDKSKLMKTWSKLTDQERTEIMLHIPRYKTEQPDKKYRKNPETYLNNKTWKDEVLGVETNNKIRVMNPETSAVITVDAETYEKYKHFYTLVK